MIIRTTCCVCNNTLEPILDLGTHYVSDFPKPGDVPGTKAPLVSPVAEQVAREVVSLPVWPGLREGELDQIADAINAL